MRHASIVSKIAHEVYEHQPQLLSDGPWWNTLDTEFHRMPEHFQLECRDQLQIGAVAMLDVALRTTAASVVAATSILRTLRVNHVLRDMEDASVYAKLLDTGRALEFYPQPGKNLVFHERVSRSPSFLPEGGKCVDLSWQSQFSPYNPCLGGRYLAHAANLVARARYFRHEGPARPTVVVVHGFAAERYGFNERLFQVRWLYERLGLDVVCFTLPFHGPRRARSSAYSGQRFVCDGMCWTAEAFRQTVLDFRALLNYLEDERGAPSVGVTGISLGGYTTALLASLEPRLAFAIPNVPIVSLPDVMLEWNPVGLLLKTAMLAARVPLQEVRHRMAVHSPLSFRPVIPKERLMIVGGVGDRLAPPKHARLLWEHWDRPTIHWFPGNHLIHLDQGAYLRYIARFLARIEFLPQAGKARSARRSAQRFSA
jgi:pimeloyl-ACP methyl ester carboxylesterase